METKKLSEEQNEELKDYVELQKSYHNTIKLLSNDILILKEKMWKRIKEWHPEMKDDKEYEYDSEKGEVIEHEK